MVMMSVRIPIWLAGIVVILFSQIPAHAEPVFQYDERIAGGFFAGQPATGTLRVNSSAVSSGVATLADIIDFSFTFAGIPINPPPINENFGSYRVHFSPDGERIIGFSSVILQELPNQPLFAGIPAGRTLSTWPLRAQLPSPPNDPFHVWTLFLGSPYLSFLEPVGTLLPGADAFNLVIDHIGTSPGSPWIRIPELIPEPPTFLLLLAGLASCAFLAALLSTTPKHRKSQNFYAPSDIKGINLKV
jgi:hypothetical protein